MSRRTLTGLLFAAFFFLLPIPFVVMGGVAWAPLLRLFALAGLMGTLGIVDGVHGLMGIALAMVLIQALALGFAVWFFAALCLRVARGFGGERAEPWFAMGLALALAAVSLFPIYITPTSSTGSPSHVFEILD